MKSALPRPDVTAEHPVEPSPEDIYTFDRFRLDASTRRLTRDGVTIPLVAKAFDTLVMLVRNHDRVVGKDELMEAMWPGTFVSDESLAQCVSAVRRALGRAELVATLPRHGYRFIGDVQTGVAGAREAAVLSGPDLPTEVNDTVTLPPGVQVSAPLPRALPPSVWFIAGIAATAVIVLLIRTMLPAAQGEAHRTVRFAQDPPLGTTGISGGALSPDGALLAFVAEDAESTLSQLWVRTLGSGALRRLDGTEGATRPFWSPDGQSIGFFAGGSLQTIRASGGTPRVVVPVRNPVFGGAWSPDGLIIFGQWRAGLDIVAAVGGPVRPLTELDQSAGETSHASPQFLADGKHFLYYVNSSSPTRAGTYLGALGSPTKTRILDGGCMGAQVALNYLLCARGTMLLAQPFDPVRFTLTGTPFSVQDDVASVRETPGMAFSSAAGDVLTYSTGSTTRGMVWLDRTGSMIGTISGSASLRSPELSRDGKHLLVDIVGANGPGVGLVDLARGSYQRLAANAATPVQSPDGTTVAFTSEWHTGGNLFIAPLSKPDGTSPHLVSNDPKFLTDWSHDGKNLLYVSSSRDTGSDLWILPMSGAREPLPYLRTRFNETQGQFSPDGRWVSYTSDESGAWEVYVQSFPVPGRKQVISVGGGTESRWRGDGKEIYYLAPDHTVMAVSIADGEPLGNNAPTPLFRAPISSGSVPRHHYAVTSDGQRFLIDSVSPGSGRNGLAVVANWNDR